MFCDLAESTALVGQLELEDWRDLVRSYQATCAAVIRRFEGHIAQYLGDGILVYFGYPQAHEDDAQRAVRASLGVLEAMSALRARVKRDQGLRLAVRVGIHTGLVVVGDIGEAGHYEPLALGDTPHIASRLQHLAEPDTVVLSAATQRLIAEAFDCRELGHQTLRGVAEPIMVYRVMGERAEERRLHALATRPLPPMVGRDPEAAQLAQHWQRVRTGVGHVLLLSGEAGVGKSRLVQELKTHVASERHIWLECRCLPYHQHSALYPLIELLQRLLQLRRDETPAEQLAKLERMLRFCRIPLAETVPLFAALLSIFLPPDSYPPLHLTPQQQRHQTFTVLRSILKQLASKRPVVFLMEGLHGVDPSTLELLTLLIDKEPLAHVLVILTYRPEFIPSWSPGEHLTAINLQRLPRDQVDAMVMQLTAGKVLPSALHRHIVSRADGIPLFVEELTKMVLESGFLQEGPRHYELVGPLPDLAIPATLQDSLMARLDRLVTARGVAQLGAVIGRQFPYALLRAVSELDEATLQRELGRLRESDLLYQRGELPQATYMFKHAMIQEAAYQSLLKSTRQQVHKRLLQVLADQFPDVVQTQPELLAYHATEAGLTNKAIGYWHQAGQHALQRSANIEAVAHFRQGLALLDGLADTPERPQQELSLQAALATALITTQGFAAPEVIHAYLRARDLCQQVSEPVALFPILRGLWVCLEVRADLPAARTLGQQLMDLAKRFPEPGRLVEAHRALGNTLFWLGEFETAQAHLDQGIALYDVQAHHGLAVLYGTDPGVICRAYAAWNLWLLGFPQQALTSGQQALALARELGHAHSEAAAITWLGVLHQMRREASEACVQAEALLELADAQGFPHWLAEGIILRGWAQAIQGETETGLRQIQHGLAAYRVTGAEVQRPYFLTLQAEAYLEAGHYDEGLKALNDSLHTAYATGEHWYLAEQYRLQGILLLAQQHAAIPEAETALQQALNIARHQGAKSLHLRTALNLAQLWQRQGKLAQARDVLSSLYNGFTEGSNTPDLQAARRFLVGL
jgi:predicted ATPase/class 3 adenylate cyclase